MKHRSLLLVLGVTGTYWAWESRAQGNIRVDLLLIYPLLFGVYVFVFWKRFRWASLGLALLLMAVNAAFFVNSAAWFDKRPG